MTACRTVRPFAWVEAARGDEGVKGPTAGRMRMLAAPTMPQAGCPQHRTGEDWGGSAPSMTAAPPGSITPEMATGRTVRHPGSLPAPQPCKPAGPDQATFARETDQVGRSRQAQRAAQARKGCSGDVSRVQRGNCLGPRGRDLGLDEGVQRQAGNDPALAGGRPGPAPSLEMTPSAPTACFGPAKTTPTVRREPRRRARDCPVGR